MSFPLKSYEDDLNDARAAFEKLQDDSIEANEPLAVETYDIAERRVHNAYRMLTHVRAIQVRAAKRQSSL